MASMPSSGPASNPPEVTLDQISQQGLKHIRQLRESITGSMEVLAGKNDGEAQGADRQDLVHRLKSKLIDVKDSYDFLDRTAQNFLARNTSTLMNENLQNQYLNASFDEDQHSQFGQLQDTLSGMQRVMEYSNFSWLFLQPISGNRRAARPTTLQQIPPSLLPLIQHYAPALQVAVLDNSSRFSTILQITACNVYSPDPTRPGTRTVPIFKVALVLRSQGQEGMPAARTGDVVPMPEWANVKGPDEEFRTKDGKLDIRSESRHEVFTRLSGQVKGWILAGGSFPGTEMRLLSSILMSLYRYRGLFSEPCKVCRKMLRNFLPPFYMDRKTCALYHEHCKP